MQSSTKFNSLSLQAVGLIVALYGFTFVIVPVAIAKPDYLKSLAQLPANAINATYGTNFSGTVERYLLNREGLADGLILNNRLQVKFPPHESDSLINTVKPGDLVTVTGTPGVSNRFGQEVHAYSITNTSSGRTIVDRPPASAPTPAAANYTQLSAQGAAQYWLIGRQGELNGIILTDGTQIKFPPHVGYQLSNLAKPGARVEVQGVGMKSRYGKILEATSLTIDRQTIPIDAAAPEMPSGVPPVFTPPAPAPVTSPASGTPAPPADAPVSPATAPINTPPN